MSDRKLMFEGLEKRSGTSSFQIEEELNDENCFTTVIGVQVTPLMTHKIPFCKDYEAFSRSTQELLRLRKEPTIEATLGYVKSHRSASVS